MADEQRRYEKGFFTPRRLPVADRYVRAGGRGRLFAVGGAVALVLLLVFLGDAFAGRARMVSNGALSSGHALFGGECATCHTSLSGTPDMKCESCHQRLGGEMGAYSFARHYLYESGDVDRSAPAAREVPCASCHREHQGRSASLQQVADAQCASCHTFGSFSRGHPEFSFAESTAPDPVNLHFPHALHVREIIDEYALVDAESSCMQCHTPRPDGRTFEPISFARACDGCHLTTSTSTPFLRSAGAAPRVATLGEIRRSGGPEGVWAEFWSAAEFNDRGGEVQKRPAYHADPWILYNLQKLRRELYPGAELADLLRTSSEVRPGQQGRLHREAIATLRSQIQALRGDPSPSVQRELHELTELLQAVERQIERPFAPLDERRFDVGAGQRADLAESEVAAYNQLVDALTEPCRVCHVVERATIRRVQADQRALVRAQFDHRAHVTHARCLDCHNAIPIRDALAADTDLPHAQDNAGIQNLPTIASCQQCHRRNAAPTNCTSCHLFHPDKSHWSNLSR